MNFINPIEILQLQDAPYPDSIDSGIIKRQKRKLFAEIELSDDGLYNYNGTKIQKSDCERVVDELSNDDNKEYYYQLATTLKSLNDYLISGNDKFFAHFKQESIYKLDDFINFINPAFAQNFDRSLLKAFKNNDTNLFSSILRTQMLVNSTNITTAFKSLSIELQNRISQIDKIKNDIKRKEGVWDDGNIDVIVDFVKKAFPVDILNTLPPYFQSPINKIADSINLLGKAIWETYDNAQATNDLLVYLLQLNIGSVDKKTFEDNFKIVKRRNDERIEQEKNAPVLKKWADILSQIKTATINVDEKILSAKRAAFDATANISITELNSLPAFANEIRNQIGYALRSLSISSWNAQKDIDVALKLIKQAMSINVSHEAYKKFETDLKDLQDIKAKSEIQSSTTITGKSTNPQEDKLIKGVFIALGIILLFAYLYATISNPNNSPTSSYNSYSNNNSTDNSDGQPDKPKGFDGIVKKSSPSEYPSSSNGNQGTGTSVQNTEQLYKSVKMKNGNIGSCSGLKPLYDYSINNKLIITADMTDGAVKIINYFTNRCIRFVFINNGTTYTVKNIPEGKYYLKIAYGNNWEIKEGTSICEGHFASNASYKRDDDIYDFNKEYYADGRVSIPYYKLRLYRSYSLHNANEINSDHNSISENDFFNDN